MELFRDEYEIMMAEDKSLDKGFKRDFSDQDPATVEHLYKLFKRRPRFVMNNLHYPFTKYML